MKDSDVRRETTGFRFSERLARSIAFGVTVTMEVVLETLVEPALEYFFEIVREREARGQVFIGSDRQSYLLNGFQDDLLEKWKSEVKPEFHDNVEARVQLLIDAAHEVLDDSESRRWSNAYLKLGGS